ncbi:MAG: M81 family metallopeptidase [Pseudomonadota bacterium]
MTKILIVECKQEISSFNPTPSDYDNFAIQRGDELTTQRGLNTEIGGALSVFDARQDVEIVAAFGARAGSAGLLSAEGWQKLSAECLNHIDMHLDGIDAVYFSLHGAMGASGELDPEGYLLSELRQRVGPDLPIVISLDLHGILTDRMIRQINGFAIYHTYPHVDFADTGQRAARLLMRIVDEGLKPGIVRVQIPALVRGDECITKTGCYGDLIREAQLLERNGTALAAGIMIGNPFTDVPELCSQVLLAFDRSPEAISQEAEALAQRFWQQRHRLQGKFISLSMAIEQARHMDGPVVFTDAADATSSGASGDSNLIIRALIESRFPKSCLAQIVDAQAAAAAHTAGVGATIAVTLGGETDPDRFPPLLVSATVEALTAGRSRLETMGMPLDAGPTAVLSIAIPNGGTITVVVMTHAVSLFDRAMYYSCGLNPEDFDVIVVKSPHTEYEMYDAWVEQNFNIDIPGATSANLPTLGHTICARPIFPLDDGVVFEPKASVYPQGRR